MNGPINGIATAIRKFFEGQPIVKFGLLLGLALVLSATAAALFLFEGYLQFGGAGAREPTFPASHDRRSKPAVVAELRAKGDKKAAPIVYPASVLWQPEIYAGKTLAIDGEPVLPLSGLSSRTTVLCNEAGYWAVYPADERGFNNPPGMWSGPVDVAVIGDSFAHGNCVNAGEDWPSQVRVHVPRTLNLGMGGNGPLFALATLKERCEHKGENAEILPNHVNLRKW